MYYVCISIWMNVQLTYVDTCTIPNGVNDPSCIVHTRKSKPVFQGTVFSECCLSCKVALELYY